MKCLWLFAASIRTKIDDNTHWNKSCDGEHCFFLYLKKCDLIWKQNVAVHSIIYKTPSLYIKQIKNPSSYFVKRPCLSLDTLRGSKTTSKPGLFDKICLKNDANLSWYSRWVPAGVQYRCRRENSSFFIRLHQHKSARQTIFLLAFVLSN